MYALRLFEDRLVGAPQEPSLHLRAAPRVLYVWEGRARVLQDDIWSEVGADHAWFGSGECLLADSPAPARILRYELATPRDRGDIAEKSGVITKSLLEHPIDLDPDRKYLMRCDRVDFDPGGEALPHGHKGGGIRCLIAGALEVRVRERPGQVVNPGEAWFEGGITPVHAIASKTEPTSFIRVSILPREIRGQSSIVYVDPTHAAVKPRKYTVYVDEPIDLR